eukprot:CAMPEP_0119097210 /NCGR_PEP_ID=MMETSP1178-20130426/175363_1 /TAXON_ID=33656 /ORGANISM="unid sp, Strain CCMP2000" /LENGTH=206 /DNA_ID=CAMNT_0007081143 /DNA_START=35 /DNA_END=655 /DNA_ORIENTATION=-
MASEQRRRCDDEVARVGAAKEMLDLRSFANEWRGPSLLASAWRHAGMGVTHARLKAVGSDHVDMSVVVCSGNVCSSRLLSVPLHQLTAQEWLASLSLSPPVGVFLQPLTLLVAAAIVCFAALLCCPTSQGDTILLILGGRDSAWLVGYAAITAHIVEAAVAAQMLTKLRAECDARSALLWLGGTLLLGFPVLRFLLQLDQQKAPRR